MSESTSTGSILFRDVSLDPPDAKADAVRDYSVGPVAPAYTATEHGSSGMLWGALLALALALAALGAYDYWFITKNGASISQLPAVISSVGSMGARLDSVEAQMKDWASDRQALMALVAKTNTQVHAGLNSIRAETHRSIAAAETQMNQVLEARAAPLDARLSQVETQQQADHTDLAQLKNSVGDLRRQVDLANAVSNENRRILANQPAQTQPAEGVAGLLPARARLSFELSKGAPATVAPGISVRVTKTNVTHQSFSGWIAFLPDQHFIVFKNQDADRPVSFYSPQGEGPYDLVVSSVSKQGVGGYVIMPPADGGAQSSAARQTASGAASNPEE